MKHQKKHRHMTRKQGYVTCNDKFLVMNVLIRLIQ
jgi:hypothetical protein